MHRNAQDGLRSKVRFYILAVAEHFTILLGIPLKRNRLRWYGHVSRRDNDHVLSKAAEMEMEGVRPRGRPKKTWKWCVEQDMRERNIGEENIHN